jgi:hypothetical protein
VITDPRSVVKTLVMSGGEGTKSNRRRATEPVSPVTFGSVPGVGQPALEAQAMREASERLLTPSAR